MASFLHSIFFTSTIFLILITCSSHAKQHSKSILINECPKGGPIRGVYYPSWKAAKFPPSSINTTFFTHIFYAFLIPNNVTFQFNITRSEATLLKSFTSTLKKKNPLVQTLLSIGGGDSGWQVFSRMASAKSSRAAFINSTLKVAKDYGFKGCDLDYESPQNTKDMDNLAILLEEWRKAAGENFLITAAVYYSATLLSGSKRSYPADSITQNLDFVNVMNYDYHGSWDKEFTGAHAALYDPKTNLSTNYGIGMWIEAGVPRCKLVMGMPLYGKTYTLKDPTKSHGVGAPAGAVGPGEGGNGIMTYDQIVNYNEKHKVTGVFDPDTVSVYSVSGKTWIGYDDTRSVAVKVSFAKALDLGGYFFWEVTGDDQDWTISKRASDVILLLNQTWNARS